MKIRYLSLALSISILTYSHLFGAIYILAENTETGQKQFWYTNREYISHLYMSSAEHFVYDPYFLDLAKANKCITNKGKISPTSKPFMNLTGYNYFKFEYAGKSETVGLKEDFLIPLEVGQFDFYMLVHLMFNKLKHEQILSLVTEAEDNMVSQITIKRAKTEKID